MHLIKGDCLEQLKNIPDKSVDLVLTDPPYNIGKARWDKIPDYINWCMEWIRECERVLTDTGSMYIWHGSMPLIAELMMAIDKETSLAYRELCIWIKPKFRKMAWNNPSEKNNLRTWFNICEYCLYYVKNGTGRTGLDRINSDPACYRPLKNWYQQELLRLGLTEQDIAAKYTEVTGRKPHMLRHYFTNSQFAIPTQQIYEAVYKPLGFSWSHEALRGEYEALRPVHNTDANHVNVWLSDLIKGNESSNKNHICEKPVDVLMRIIKTSSRPGAMVLDCFMGSGSVGVACLKTGRDFIGIEAEEKSFQTAKKRIQEVLDNPHRQGGSEQSSTFSV